MFYAWTVVSTVPSLQNKRIAERNKFSAAFNPSPATDLQKTNYAIVGSYFFIVLQSNLHTV